MARPCRLAVFRSLDYVFGGEAPTISGTETVEQTLTGSGGSGAWQWQYQEPSDDSWNDITGATSSTYVIDGLYGSRLLRVVRGGTPSTATGAINPNTVWTLDFESGVNGDSVAAQVEDLQEDGSPTGYSQVSTAQHKFGTRSMHQHSSATDASPGSRVYMYTGITEAGLPVTTRQYWYSFWIYCPVIMEQNVGAGDWINLAQIQSHRQTGDKRLDPIWMLSFTTGLSVMQLSLIFWPSNVFGSNPPALSNAPRSTDNYANTGPGGPQLTLSSGVTMSEGVWHFIEWMCKPNSWVNSTTANYDGEIRLFMDGAELTNCRVQNCITKYFTSGSLGGTPTGFMYIGKEAYGDLTGSGDVIDEYIDRITLSWGRRTYYLDQ